jgi:UDP-N-acetylmuramate-alanine ligase
VTIEALATAIRDRTRRPVDIVPMLRDVAPALARIAQPGDLVITLGAGSIGTVAEPLIELLSRAGTRPVEAGDRT